MLKRKIGYSKKLVLLISLFLLLANGFLGTILIIQSQNELYTHIKSRMLDILQSAVALLDGDVMGKVQKEDFYTDEYQKAYKLLETFQENFKLEYIYGIRDMGDGTFTLTIDPDKESPGEFGEPIEYTEALHQASLGIPGMDKDPYEDKWGKFYSAYVPIFDSNGKVSGILAADIRAEVYESAMRHHIYTMLIICFASLIAGASIVFIISDRLHKRIVYLNSEMSQMTDEVEELASELRLASSRHDHSENNKEKTQDEEDKDSLEELSSRLKFVRKELQHYIHDAHDLAYTDSLTGASNRNAYVENLKKLNKSISEGKAHFTLAVFDINGLKNANDTFGHEHGDLLIITASEVLRDVIGTDNLFRIGGDEFVAIVDESQEGMQIEELFQKIDSRIHEKNRSITELSSKAPLSLSKGAACFIKTDDFDVRTVFRRADEAMYADKASFYKKHDRRK